MPVPLPETISSNLHAHYVPCCVTRFQQIHLTVIRARAELVSVRLLFPAFSAPAALYRCNLHNFLVRNFGRSFQHVLASRKKTKFRTRLTTKKAHDTPEGETPNVTVSYLDDCRKSSFKENC